MISMEPVKFINNAKKPVIFLLLGDYYLRNIFINSVLLLGIADFINSALISELFQACGGKEMFQTTPDIYLTNILANVLKEFGVAPFLDFLYISGYLVVNYFSNKSFTALLSIINET